jgi:hypothetical protein
LFPPPTGFAIAAGAIIITHTANIVNANSFLIVPDLPCLLQMIAFSVYILSRGPPQEAPIV